MLFVIFLVAVSFTSVAAEEAEDVFKPDDDKNCIVRELRHTCFCRKLTSLDNLDKLKKVCRLEATDCGDACRDLKLLRQVKHVPKKVWDYPLKHCKSFDPVLYTEFVTKSKFTKSEKCSVSFNSGYTAGSNSGITDTLKADLTNAFNPWRVLIEREEVPAVGGGDAVVDKIYQKSYEDWARSLTVGSEDPEKDSQQNIPIGTSKIGSLACNFDIKKENEDRVLQQSPPLEKWVSTTGLPLKREGGTRNIDDGKVSKGKYKGIDVEKTQKELEDNEWIPFNNGTPCEGISEQPLMWYYLGQLAGWLDSLEDKTMKTYYIKRHLKLSVSYGMEVQPVRNTFVFLLVLCFACMYLTSSLLFLLLSFSYQLRVTDKEVEAGTLMLPTIHIQVEQRVHALLWYVLYTYIILYDHLHTIIANQQTNTSYTSYKFTTATVLCCNKRFSNGLLES